MFSDISVIVPAYNAENSIENAINSINNKDVEIIVVIDGTTDNTKKICMKMQSEYKNLKIIEQENSGAYIARKNGIKNASGKYVMFLDSDDKYKSNTISKICEFIKRYKNPDLIRFRYERIPNGYEQYKYFDEDEVFIEKNEFINKVYPMFLEGYMLNSTWGSCVKKEVFNKISEKNNVLYGEDLLLNLEIFSNINNAVFTNEILYEYSYTNNSATTTKDINKNLKKLEDTIYVYSLLHEYIKRWNMNTMDNVKMVNDRIKKETEKIIEIIKKEINLSKL